MIRKLLPIALVAALFSACNAAQEPVAKATAALYVDSIGGGHGPFTCSGAVPGRGYVDLYTGANYTGTCYRWRGDFADNSGGTHLGYVVWPLDVVGSIRISPNPPNGDSTWAHYCTGNPQLPGDCDPHYPSLGFSTNQATVGWSWGPVVLHYLGNCPAVPGMTHLHQCTGSATPIDDSGYAAVVISDGVVSPGLPFGHPLNEPNPNSLATDCMAVLDAGLQAQFAPPPGYIRGVQVVAVYSCP